MPPASRLARARRCRRHSDNRPMSTAAPSSAAPLSSRRQRLLGGWWRRQPAHHQDRLATLTPLLSVLLFLAAMVLAVW